VYLKVLGGSHGTTEQIQRRPDPIPSPVLKRPEAGHWLVHEHRYEGMLAPFTRLVLGAAAVARTDRVLDVGCGTGSTTCTAARDADDGQALGVDISRPCCCGPNSELDRRA